MGTEKRWSQSGELTTFNTSKGLVLQKTLAQPSVFTAQFFIGGDSSRTQLGQVTLRRCFAEVDWTVGGNTTRRVISVYNGCSISGVASHVSVKMFDRSTDFSGIGPIRYDYPVSVQLAPGTRPSQQQPPQLDLRGFAASLGAAGTLSYNLETLCRTLFGFSDVGIISSYVTVSSVEANQPGVSTPDVLVSQLSTGAAVLAQYNAFRNAGWVPMFPGATQLQIALGAGIVGNMLVSAVFGIDG